MIDPKDFYSELVNYVDFISGVPDSLLKELNACILDLHDEKKHIIAPNEGISVSLAIGNFIATSKLSFVYLQNSGIGNIINPLISLADREIYSVPMLIGIGWRGEPGFKDEPQHIIQGKIQEELLKTLRLPYFIIDAEEANFKKTLKKSIDLAYEDNSPVVLLFRKDTFSNYKANGASKIFNKISNYSREKAISDLVTRFDDDKTIFIGTTGKTSRELYENRTNNQKTNALDFYTVGGMGHASSIASGIAMSTNKRVICLDGDGALLMHMGSLVSNSYIGGNNFIHVILNNKTHESVGGQPTLINYVDIKQLVLSVGYKNYFKISNSEDILTFEEDLNEGPTLLEFEISSSSRGDLGRPKESPKENLFRLKNGF